MEVVVEVACGLDVHQASVVACLVWGPGKTQREVRSFRTTREQLTALKDWLVARECTHVGMEATGVYWRPVYDVLEGALTVWVANPTHIKALRGHKTDRKDAAWIASLVRHGLMRPSFVPSKEVRDLREWVRFRKRLVEERTRLRNGTLKHLETAGVKLASVLSNVFGTSGRAMLEAIESGMCHPSHLASLARGRLREKKVQVAEACDLAMSSSFRALLGIHLGRLRSLDETVARVESEINGRLAPYRELLRRLQQVPGIGQQVATMILAELGPRLDAFPSPAHLSSWAGLCPGNHESAGQTKSGRTRKGNPFLKSALTEAAVAAGRTKGSCLQVKFQVLRSRIGFKRATIAIAHKLLVIVHHLITTGEDYRERPTRTPAQELRLVRNLTRRFESLGYQVSLQPILSGPQNPG